MPRLETARLVLRAWTLGDVDDAFAIYGDPEVVRFLGAGLPLPDREAQRAWLAPRIARWEQPDYAAYDVWAIEERASSRVIGTMMLKPLPPTTDMIEIGWHLARPAWGRGIATEAGREVLRYGFQARALERIHAVVVPENTPSVRVAQRLGMRLVERTRAYYDGEEVDRFCIDRTGNG